MKRTAKADGICPGSLSRNNASLAYGRMAESTCTYGGSLAFQNYR
jgi:hypothetical protein